MARGVVVLCPGPRTTPLRSLAELEPPNHQDLAFKSVLFRVGHREPCASPLRALITGALPKESRLIHLLYGEVLLAHGPPCLLVKATRA